MEAFLKYSLIFGAAWVGLGNYFYFRHAGRRHLSAGRFTEAELRRFSIGYGIALGGPLVLLGVLQLANGYPNPVCVFSGMGRSASSAVAIGVAMGCQGALFLWVWFGSGARVLTKFAPVLGLPAHPIVFRILATGLVALGVFALHQLTTAHWAFTQCAG